MNYLSTTDLRKQLAGVIAEVERGGEFTLIYRSKPVMKLSPITMGEQGGGNSCNNGNKYIESLKAGAGIGTRQLGDFKGKSDREILVEELKRKNG